MIKSFFAVEDTEDLPDTTGIDWLDIAIALSAIIVAQIIKEISERKMDDWQSGNAPALNPGEP